MDRRPESREGGGGRAVVEPRMECCGLAGGSAGADLGSLQSRPPPVGPRVLISAHSAEPAAATPSGTRWTCLQLDLRDVLLLYLNRRYGHLKSVRLCSSLLVKNLYTSDLCFDPGECRADAPGLLPRSFSAGGADSRAHEGNACAVPSWSPPATEAPVGGRGWLWLGWRHLVWRPAWAGRGSWRGLLPRTGSVLSSCQHCRGAAPEAACHTRTARNGVPGAKGGELV